MVVPVHETHVRIVALGTETLMERLEAEKKRKERKKERKIGREKKKQER